MPGGNQWKHMPVEERFDRQVMPEPNTGCWFWTGSISTRGYGKCYYNGHHDLAHRVSWQIHRGSIGDGLFVCHTCDEPSCVNPDHLFLGAPKDNTQDMMAKGRNSGRFKDKKGSQHPLAKLTEEAVRAARSSDLSNGALARKYGVHVATLRNARIGLTWKHVGVP
jgi:hypothetical protein